MSCFCTTKDGRQPEILGCLSGDQTINVPDPHHHYNPYIPETFVHLLPVCNSQELGGVHEDKRSLCAKQEEVCLKKTILGRCFLMLDVLGADSTDTIHSFMRYSADITYNN